MTFEVGKRYSDAVGRKWRVIEKVTFDENQDVMIVRRRFKKRIAMTEGRVDRATVFFPLGFTTIYAEEEE